MTKGKNFIDRDVFMGMLDQIKTVRGGKYQDPETIYGDLSRLVVALMASTPPRRLHETYVDFGWKPNANVRAIHVAARHWYKTYHPDRLPLRPMTESSDD